MEPTHRTPPTWAPSRPLLVPTDFSARADYAFATALDIARQTGAPIHLVHIVQPFEADALSPLRYTPEAAVRHDTPEALLYAQLEATLERHDPGPVPVELVLKRGQRAAPAILAYARKIEADLIVIATRGVTGLRHFFLGSVAEEVVHSAPCDVLLARENRPFRLETLRRILVPVDFSASAPTLLTYARQLADRQGAALDVLHVSETSPFLAPFGGIGTLADLVPEFLDQAEAWMTRLLAKTAGPEVPTETHIVEGRAAATITEFASTNPIDLIVIATHGQGGMRHALVGSVTERVVRTAPCPVLCVRVDAVEIAEASADEEKADLPTPA